MFERNLVVAASVIALLLSANTASAQSHMNQSPADHVIIHFYGQGSKGTCDAGSDTGQTLEFSRVLPDGKQTPFTIPEDRLLVVTDFDLTAYVSPTVPSRGAIQTILRLVPDTQSSGAIVYRSSFHLVGDLSANNLTKNHQSLAGLVVGPRASLCPSMSLDDGTGGESLIITQGNYRGYLIGAKP